MISGRGLGLTGGTIDKLEAVKGYSASIPENALLGILEGPGCFIVGQTEKLVPADRQLYKYRDVTGTIASFPLITSKLFNSCLLLIIRLEKLTSIRREVLLYLCSSTDFRFYLRSVDLAEVQTDVLC